METTKKSIKDSIWKTNPFAVAWRKKLLARHKRKVAINIITKINKKDD